jgi:2-haloacid dehalogenase
MPSNVQSRRLKRVTQEAMAAACRNCDLVAPLTMFKALRMQMDELDMAGL